MSVRENIFDIQNILKVTDEERFGFGGTTDVYYYDLPPGGVKPARRPPKTDPFRTRTPGAQEHRSRGLTKNIGNPPQGWKIFFGLAELFSKTFPGVDFMVL